MLRQRKPLKPGKGFRRAVYEAPPPAPLRPVARSGVYADAGAASLRLDKPAAQRNRALLDLARDMQCLLRVPGVCNGRTDTTVACHSNWAEHGKGGARKADDHWSCWGCSECHRWLDQGPAPEGEKRAIFDAGMRRQVIEWSLIAADLARAARDRAAAGWALLRHVAAAPGAP